MAKDEIVKWLDSNSKEITAFFFKTAVWVSWALLSVIASLSYKRYKGEKLTTTQIISTMGMALFVGYISFNFCKAYFPDKGAIIVPVCTLASEKIVGALLTLNWKSLIENIINTKNKK